MRSRERVLETMLGPIRRLRRPELAGACRPESPMQFEDRVVMSITMPVVGGTAALEAAGASLSLSSSVKLVAERR